MKKFEIGKEYFDTSACDHESVFTIKITKRTEKTVSFVRNGKKRRAKLFCDDRGEYIIPDRYSMAPVFRAEREVQPEPAPAPTPEMVVVMIGQRLEMVCGACFPVQTGLVIGFIDIPATRFSRGGIHAVVRWNGTDEFAPHVEKVLLSQIHQHGWRSVNGSPLGVFVA